MRLKSLLFVEELKNLKLNIIFWPQPTIDVCIEKNFCFIFVLSSSCQKMSLQNLFTGIKNESVLQAQIQANKGIFLLGGSEFWLVYSLDTIGWPSLTNRVGREFDPECTNSFS